MKTCPRCLKNLGFDSAHACTPAPYVQNMEAEVEELHLQLDSLGARLAGAEATANGFRIERDALKTKLNEAESHRINLSASQKEAQARNTGLYAENDALEEELEEMVIRLENAQASEVSMRKTLESLETSILLSSMVHPADSAPWIKTIRAALNSTPPLEPTHDEAVVKNALKTKLVETQKAEVLRNWIQHKPDCESLDLSEIIPGVRGDYECDCGEKK